MINGSRYDLLENQKPFIGSDPFLPGHSLYPAGITRQEIEAYVAKHPEKKAQIYSPFTVVKRQGGELVGVPYHIEYKPWLAGAAKALREAAALSPDKAFCRLSAVARRCAAHRRLLQERSGMARSGEPKVRHYLCSV